MNNGFFNTDEDFSADTPRDSLRNGCAACGLHRTKIHTPKMIPYLNNRLNDEENENADILFIGEAPGKNDDTQGFQFVDKSGRVLRAAIGNKAFFATNAVQCRPATKGKNRPPTEKEIGCCHRRVMVDIKRLQPKVIVPLGNVALKSLIGDRLSGPVYGINRWRGLQIPDQHYGAWICPTFHPSYVMREERNPVVSKIFKEDIDAAFDCVVKMFPRESLEEVKQQVTIYPDGKDAVNQLKDFLCHKPLLMAFDYECDRLLPQRDGEIVCMAISIGPDSAHAFPMTDEVKPIVKQILENEHIGKVAQGIGFEDTWSRVALGAEVRGWKHCTMHAAHVEDNRSKYTGLKFQVYINFGIGDYDSSVAPFLKAKDPTRKNHILDARLEDVMMYCGVDALYTYRLAVKQMEVVG